MIREIIRQAWAESAPMVIATLIVTPLAVIAIWAWLVVVLVALS